jgi:unsaturated rhamnogalacturonyl hydrolase
MSAIQMHAHVTLMSGQVMAAYIAVFILLALGLAIFILDTFPVANTWQSRIHIGRWENRAEWAEAISQVASKWLRKTPTITLTDNRRLVVIDMLRGQYRRDSIQHWQQAALLLGLAEEQKRQPDAKRAQSLADFISSIVVSGRWKTRPDEIDSAILAYAMIEASADINHIKPALDEVWALIQSRTGTDGTVYYRTHMQDFRFVDTIGFICPFLVRYGQLFDVPAAVDLAILQIEKYDAAMLGETLIPAHAFVLENRMPSGLFGWGRGMGWYAIGLADAWHALDSGHPKKPSLEARLKQFAKNAIALQRENGSWGWNATNPQSIADSSATATLAWLLTRAAGIPDMEPAGEAREKAMRYLMKRTRRNGAVDFSQGDTKGIGVYSQIFDILPFTQGFALRCAATHIFKSAEN